MRERVECRRALWLFERGEFCEGGRQRRWRRLEGLVQSILVCADGIQRWRPACKLVAEFDIVQAAVIAGRGTATRVRGLRV